MDFIPWVIIAIVAVAIIFGLIAAFTTKKYKKPPDYKAFFSMGIIWFAIGLPLKNYALFIMGLVFMAVGLAHKDKWEENKREWKDMSKQERNIIIGAMILALVVLIVGIFLYFYIKRNLI